MKSKGFEWRCSGCGHLLGIGSPPNRSLRTRTPTASTEKV